MHRRLLLKTLPGLSFGLGACTAPPAPLRVGAIAFAGYAFLFLAERLGRLDASRLRLNELRSNTDALRALSTHRIEAAALTLDEVITAVHEGVPMKVIAVLDSSQGADAVMARPSIAEPAQARGCRIGVEATATGGLVLGAFLEKAGLKPGDVQPVPMRLAQAAEAYSAGRVDLAITAEPWVTALESLGARRLFDSREMPGRIVDVLAVRSESGASHAGALRALLAAHFGALAAYRANPQALAAELAPWLKLPVEQVPSAFRGLHLPTPEESRQLLAPGGAVAVGLPGLVNLMRELRLLGGPVDVSTLIDTRWLAAPP
ncbi:ABC transporter substrate-binding protein [Rubrivivax rivuli]|uniref:Nitrate/sulfonate/bicarbonate ABC transporter n=1 Tax=Rubrivivax rivuli TaxID=1862385 RepID=A0A437RB66_9BURK|nr:ABC transporter substrate-binding protein [Rubrivivax rivuli]RVU43927.1 nitrate/sulfonate/bicarbonate ABC transporter [Rubrivivax rivuli]